MVRMITVFTGLMLVLTGWVTTAFAQRPGENPIPSDRLLNRYGLEVGWVSQATMDTSRDKISQFAIDERAIVTVTTTGMVNMFDAETGQKLWVNRIGRGDQATFPPVFNDRYVLIVSGLTLYSLDRETGGMHWQVTLPAMPSTGPTADDHQIYVGTLDGSVYAFDLKKIGDLYQERLLPDYSLATRVWRYKAGQKVTSPPISHGRSVSFASLDRSLYTVGANTRKLLYQFETDAPISAPLVIHKDYLFLASEDFNFYCLNAKNGQVRWSFLSGLPIRKAPYVIEGHVRGVNTDVVYVLPESGGMNAIDAYNGFQIWEGPQSRAVDFRAATQDYLFVTDQIDNILILEKDHGDVIGIIPANSYTVATQNERTDRLFLCQESGLVVMIRQQDSRFPAYYKFPERRPISPLLYDPASEPVEPADAASVPGDTTDLNATPGTIPGNNNAVPGNTNTVPGNN